MDDGIVPTSLRTWFVIHFFVDMAFGIPLLLVPVYTLAVIGVTNVETTTARLVGAALMGIGIESFLGRNGSHEVYDAMLNLKLIWSGSAILGVILSLLGGVPPAIWLILGIFVIFFIVWARYKLKIRA
jgi:hypothetical protein